MKVTINKQKLFNFLDIASRFISKNSTLPILQNIYIKANIDELVIRATDMEKFVEIQIPAIVEGEGATTIEAKTLLEIVRSIDDENLEMFLDQEKDSMTIKSSVDDFSINGISANEYVSLPEMPSSQSVSIDSKTFSEGIQKVEYAVADKNYSPIFTGVLIRKKQLEDSSFLTFVGTDSFRLAEFKVPFKGKTDNLEIIIPKNNINDIKRIADLLNESGEAEKINIKFSHNLVAFEFKINDAKIMATSLLIQGTFPDYENEKIMPTSFNTKIIVNKEQGDKAVKKITLFTKDMNTLIQIESKSNSIEISSGETDRGGGKTSIPAIFEGNDIKMNLNGKHILDFTRNISGNELYFNIVDEKNPVVLTSPENTNYRYIVRPINR